jgi:hypothetical protein
MPFTIGKTNGRFELPALTPITFSLTDGTDIPPPDSPIEEIPAPAAPKEAAIGNSPISGNGTTPPVWNGHGQTTSSMEQPPLSPASTRPASIRRFLSRKSLNSNYTNGTSHNISQEDLTNRPESPASFFGGPPKTAKRSGSWFRKLGGSNTSKRASIVFENKVSAKPMGPPPPKLPELNQLKAKLGGSDEGSLGGEDMFNNIKGE